MVEATSLSLLSLNFNLDSGFVFEASVCSDHIRKLLQHRSLRRWSSALQRIWVSSLPYEAVCHSQSYFMEIWKDKDRSFKNGFEW